MKKKLILLVGTMCLAFSMIACGNTQNNTNTNDKVTPTTAPTQSPDDVTPEITPDITPEVTPDVTPDDGSGDIVWGVIGSDLPDVVVDTIFNKVKELMPNDYFANMPMTAEDIALRYNIAPEAIEYAYGEIPMIMVNIDSLVAVKAKDVDAVKAAFDNYVQVLKDDAFQYPKNAACIPAIEVVVHGDYVFLVGIFGDVMVGEEPTDADMLAIAQSNVDKVVNIIESYFNQ